MPQKGRAIQLYSSDISFDVFEDGINKIWVEKGEIVFTRFQIISNEEFSLWLHGQPQTVQLQVRENLQRYIHTTTPKEVGQDEFPRSRYLFGY